MDLREMAENYVNGPDNGSADVLEALLRSTAYEAFDQGATVAVRAGKWEPITNPHYEEA